MAPEAAEILALRALEWLAADTGLMQDFVSATGISSDDIQFRATDADFLGSVLDFLMTNDANVVEFATASGINPEVVADARLALPGGQVTHWT